ncbi:hypothetical protein [Granulosicoccus antarcticus]|uniref:Lipocalin-like domain-containing protein n=1 Tax=Granulosicoccus antarcticus IMCC3135 TaxID=1192854 RepID=A0A2Z2NGI9_9GAMM|nr:hypothetical protein [Granulosicoccus antarcticus]ASJ70382.1 hypothetical protein IMCC3135_01315 [Granulosicoccus antarcticus IMCC3135]
MLTTALKINPLLPTMAGALLLLSACDSSTGGGAAGDVDDSPAAIALLAPFTGFYDLQDDWNGQLGDEAFLIIETPGSDVISPASFYDFDDISNCVPITPSRGEVTKEPIKDLIFMDGIFQFNEAELTLSGNTLTIEFNDDADLDNDGSTFDRVSVTATKVGFSQVSDLGDSC